MGCIHMSDSIRVTFGGREVVLKRDPKSVFPGRPDVGIWRCVGNGTRLEVQRAVNDAGYYAFFRKLPDIETHYCSGADSPQAAVSAVESKLRDLVKSIQGVLGEKP